MTDSNRKSALIAMSGGVDSSVAAHLMKEAGFVCMGTTMNLYRKDEIGYANSRVCCSRKDIDDAGIVAYQMGIPFEVLDFTEDFKEHIIDKFIKVYEAGGTPNPCIDCNRYMKFDKLLDYACDNGFDYVVTGHYARIEFNDKTGRYELLKALDQSKDQSYVLYSLTQEQLAHTRFPLGGMLKEETRKIAEANGFVNARKRDSQDICFVPDGDYVRFMQDFTGKTYPDGKFVNEEGQVLGDSRNSVKYTIGQRKGLGIAMGKPVYVVDKDMEANTVTLGDEPALFHRSLIAEAMNWISVADLTEPMRVKAKVRYRQAEQWATAYPADWQNGQAGNDGATGDAADGAGIEGNGASGSRIKVVFDEPQRAITAGQALVLYDGDKVVGGGTITGVVSDEE